MPKQPAIPISIRLWVQILTESPATSPSWNTASKVQKAKFQVKASYFNDGPYKISDFLSKPLFPHSYKN